MSRKEKIQQMLQESPDDVFLNYSLAMELSKAGEVSEARAAFAHVRALDSAYVPAYFMEAQMLAQNDQVEAARELLQAGILVARENGDQHALGEMTDYLESL